MVEAEQGPVSTPGSSNGKTAGSEPADSGSNPLPGMDECWHYPTLGRRVVLREQGYRGNKRGAGAG